jgi:hypothetical protein
MKKSVKNQLHRLVNGEPEPVEQVTIFIENDVTGERTLYGQWPNNKKVEVIADSPATAETFKKLRNINSE